MKIFESFCCIIQANVTIGCSVPYDTEVTNPGTYITSLNHPENYEDNQDCMITIVFPSRIKLEFISFNVEDNANCDYDYLMIFDGLTTDSLLTPQGGLCGSTIPNSIVSTENTIVILFHTDSTGTEAGFLIRAMAYDGGMSSFPLFR